MTARPWIGWLTAAALAAQAAAPAWASMPRTSAPAAPPPCHGAMQADASAATRADDGMTAADCCDDSSCATLCAAAGCALPSVAPAPTRRGRHELAAAPRVPHAAPAHFLTPLRPPIVAPL